MSEKATALARFCSRFGADFRALSARDWPYTIEHAPADGFDGGIAAIRVFGVGRFGNRFYQLLNAILLARHLGIDEVQFDFRTPSGSVSRVIPPMRVVPMEDGAGGVPTLAGVFFTAVGFEPILEPFDPAFVAETVRAFVVPFHDEYVRAATPMDDDVVAMHFRSGDIFGDDNGWVPPHYVLPPASYYAKAAEHALAERGAKSVRIVYEDDRNPTIAVVAAYLTRRGIPFTMQSSSLEEDVGTLLSARHLVGPFGTFCEAIAMLSQRLVSYYGFRQIESHHYLHRRDRSLMEAVLTENGVQMFLVEDAAGGYIPNFTFQNSEPQRELMRSYPQDSLRVGHHVPKPPWGWNAAGPAAKVALNAARREAALLRQKIDPASRATPSDSDRRGLKIDFGRGGNGRFFIRSGWSEAEGGFTWTSHSTASLAIPIAARNGGYRCVMHLLPHIRPAGVPIQEMIISVQGRELYRASFDSGTWTNVGFDIPADVTRDVDVLRLELAFPLAVAPKTLDGSGDARTLGVAVHSLRLEEIDA